MTAPAARTDRRRLVAVTGATGFIGRHLLVELAAQGWQPRILVRRLSPLPSLPDGLQIVMGSLQNRHSLGQLLQGCDAVVHLAGAIKARRNADFFATNVEGTRELLRQITEADLRIPVILASSLAAREPHLSPYAASKRQAEELAHDPQAAVRPVTLRIPVVYGPGDRETLSIFRMAKYGLFPSFGSPGNRLSLIHVSDLVRVMAGILSRPPPSAIYEVDDGTAGGYAFGQVMAEAAGHFSRRVRFIPVPRLIAGAAADLVQAGARLRGRAAILSPGKVREMYHPDWVCHDRSLFGLLDWRPRFDLASGFADTIRWYRTHNWL